MNSKQNKKSKSAALKDRLGAAGCHTLKKQLEDDIRSGKKSSVGRRTKVEKCVPNEPSMLNQTAISGSKKVEKTDRFQSNMLMFSDSQISATYTDTGNKKSKMATGERRMSRHNLAEDRINSLISCGYLAQSNFVRRQYPNRTTRDLIAKESATLISRMFVKEKKL